MLNLKPTSNRLIVSEIKKDTTRPSGLILSNPTSEHIVRGEVLAAGKGLVTNDGTLIEMSTRLGDIVHYNKYAAVEIEVEGAKYHVIKEDDVFLVEQ
jgi:chaperonin GroES